MRYFLRMLALSGTVCIGALLLMLGGCDKQARVKSWTQSASDTRAAVQAAEQTPDPAARLRLYEAIGRSVLILTDELPMALPKPTQTPEQIVANPAPFIASVAVPVAKLEQPKPAVDTLAPLKDDARLAIRIGAWVGLIGSILWVASLFIDVASLAPGWYGTALRWFAKLGFVWRIAASVGGVAVVVGACVLWALNHPWVIAGAIACGLAWVALIHHKDVAAGWHRALCLINAILGRMHAHTAPPKPSPAMAPAIPPAEKVSP
jgi:hypothetical protein